jgi:hypothetical protein
VIKKLENGCDFHEAHRFLAPYDYLETSHPALEQTIGVKAIPSSGSDHRLLVLTGAIGAKKIQGRGLWKHNNALLKEDEYCKLMEETIIEARKTRCSDAPAQTWDWIKHRVQDVLVNFSKKRSK